MKKSFKAVIQHAEEWGDAAFVEFPFDVAELYKTKGQVKINATFDGQPYRGLLAPMGEGVHYIGLRKDIRKAIGKSIGDQVIVTVEPDLEERTVTIPDELQLLFKRNPKAEKFFQTLSYTNRKEYVVWITSAKKEETRKDRLQKTVAKLLEGKKNPSEK